MVPSLTYSVLAVDGDSLCQRVCVAVVNEDRIRVGHDRVPIGALGKCDSRNTCGQGNSVGKGDGIGVQADDKRPDKDYEPRNHHNGHRRDQSFQIGDERLVAIVFRSLIHGPYPCVVYHRGKSASTS